MILKIFPLLVLFFVAVNIRAQTAPNSHYDDYAPAFRQLPNGGSELWFTLVDTSRPGGRSRRIMVSRCTKDGFEAPAPLDDPNINFVDPARSAANGVVLNGVPSFRCDGTYGVFVSNRLVNGRDFGNDIYEMSLSTDGHWQVRRIDEVDSDSWDDTPSLSADGNILYFSSDRRNPGRKHTELFYSRRLASGSWSPAAPIDVLDDAPGNHEAPFAGPDGFFYFSTNNSGRYQIWRSRMKDGLPTNSGEQVPFAGVNSKTSDQTDPAFSPGGNWMLFTSNRADSGRTRDQDIYWVRANTRQLTVLGNVQELERIHDQSSIEVGDSSKPLSTNVQFTGDDTNFVTHSDLRGNFVARFPHGLNPASDLSSHTGQFLATTQNAEFVASPVVLHYILDLHNDTEKISLVLVDTESNNDPSGRRTFPIADVRFFIEGYWGPTTKHYREFLDRYPLPSCPSFFDDGNCIVAKPNNEQCQSNNLYEYKYDSVRSSDTLHGKRQQISNAVEYHASRSEVSPCFNYSEFREFGEKYAAEVDRALDKLDTDMQNALTTGILGEKQKTDTIEITITGFTDPKSVDFDCDYSGDTIDFSKEIVQMIDSTRQSDGSRKIDSAMERRFVTGEPMRLGHDDGNPLLSALRAYWATVLLDSIWYSNIQQYRDLRNSNRLILNAIGKSKNKNEALTFAQRRSISIEIKAITKGSGFQPGLKSQPEQVVDLWNQCGIAKGNASN